jgi:hypothetical protein
VQIEISFDVFQSLTSMRKSENDSYNDVIRRLLKLPDANSGYAPPLADQGLRGIGAGASGVAANMRPLASPSGLGGIGAGASGVHDSRFDMGIGNVFSASKGGVWYNNVHFPENSRFRATYKGKTYLAEVRNGKWIGEDGVVRRSPSDAASAVSGTNVNGWRFWHVLVPHGKDWIRLEEFRQ